MKTVYLFRHAKSSWDDPQLSDFERPLNERGKRDAPRMGQVLATKNVNPALWVSSPARRAWSTAKKVAAALSVQTTAIAKVAALYHAEPEALLQTIRNQPDEADSVIIFGHNPGLTDFATLLCDYAFGNIPTSGVACMRFAAETWAEVDYHQGELVFFEYPKKLLE